MVNWPSLGVAQSKPSCPPVTRPRNSPRVTEATQAAASLAIALAGGINQRQVAGLARGVTNLGIPLEKPLLQSDQQSLWNPDPARRTAIGDGIAIVDQPHRFGRAHDFAFRR